MIYRSKIILCDKIKIQVTNHNKHKISVMIFLKYLKTLEDVVSELFVVSGKSTSDTCHRFKWNVPKVDEPPEAVVGYTS